MRRASLLFCGLALAVTIPFLHGSTPNQERELELVGKVTFEPINEMSGIVKSRKHPNTYWVHNDSGDKPRFFAVRQNGDLIAPAGDTYAGIQVPRARNSDWEDIATDGRHLFISDLGNNGNARRDLGVYVVKEPDPLTATSAPILKFAPVAYADQKEFPPADLRFDCEAIFYLRGKLYAITKHRINRLMPANGANLYRFESLIPGKTNLLKRVDGAKDLGGWVTAADVSPDGKTLAVLTQAPTQSVWLFGTGAKDDKLLSTGKKRQIKFTGAKQCEAIAWADNKTLLITNEQRDIFRLIP